jgi:hypothetical protein
MTHAPKKQRSGSIVLALLLLLPFQDGCGTIVGNPKKPPNNEGETSEFFKLPLIEFAVPDSATQDDADVAGLALIDAGLSSPQNRSFQAGDLENGGQKTLLVAWSKRLDRSLKEINRLSERINKIIDDERSEVVDRVLTFKQKGQGQLGATIQQIANADPYAYEALLCHGATPVSHVKWSKDQKKIAITRDFGPLVDGYEDSIQLLTSLVLEKTEVLSIELRAFGEAGGDLPDEPGKGFVERGVITKDEASVITVKTVSDFYNQPVPETFSGSSYLTGRMIPDEATGGKPFKQEFVGYYEPYAFCKNGFDENDPDLWSPDFSGPRFCLGRPVGAKRFDSIKEFLSTIKNLETVGILRSETLAPVAIETSLACP